MTRVPAHAALRLALTGVASLLCCAPALATPAWLPATDLSVPGQSANAPQVAFDAQGDATAIWARFDGTGYVVQAATRPAGGTWQAAVDVSAPGPNLPDPQLAIDPQGDATAVWLRDNGISRVVQAALRPAGGVWQAPVDLSAPGANAQDPGVAVDQNGTAIAAWDRSNGTNRIVQAALRPAGGAWQAPTDLSLPGRDAAASQVTVDPQGDAAAVWYRSDGSNTIVQAALRPAGGVWQAPANLSGPGENATAPRVALDPQGNAVAVWSRSNGTTFVVQASQLPAGGTWQPPVDLSVPEFGGDQRVALDPQGNATAVWDRYDGTNFIVQAALRPAGGTWQAPVDLSQPGQDASPPQLAVDPRGNAIPIWVRYDGNHFIAQAAVHPAAGSWQTPVDLSTPGQSALDPQVAVDPQGDAVAVWDRSNGTNTIVQAAGYDAVGPQLRGESVPAAGVVGVPVSFSVSPFDLWSAIASTTWSFGDGGSAAGASVSHTYANPGSYVVGLSSADTLANATSATAGIVIAPGPPPPATAGAPALTSVSQSHRRWREGFRHATIARRRTHRPPIGTSFAFTVNRPVRVTFSFTQRVRRRTLTRGTLSYSVRSGRRRLAFQGRLGRGRLPLGAYALAITAASTAPAQRSQAAVLHFTIVK